MKPSTTPTPRPGREQRASTAPARAGARVAAPPTGTAAPTEPSEDVDPEVQALMQRVRPAPGYALAQLVQAAEREQALGLPAGTSAALDSAMLRLLAMHPHDDLLAREHPVGTIVFASLEGIAPLLGTYVYLVPLERVQGTLPAPDADDGAPMGFRD